MTIKTWLALPLEAKLMLPLTFVKIDAGFAAPEGNSELKNRLAGLSLANVALSDAVRALLLAQSEDAAITHIQRGLAKLGLYPDGTSRAGEAYAVRMSFIASQLRARPNATAKQINDALMQWQPPLSTPLAFANDTERG